MKVIDNNADIQRRSERKLKLVQKQTKKIIKIQVFIFFVIQMHSNNLILLKQLTIFENHGQNLG